MGNYLFLFFQINFMNNLCTVRIQDENMPIRLAIFGIRRFLTNEITWFSKWFYWKLRYKVRWKLLVSLGIRNNIIVRPRGNRDIGCPPACGLSRFRQNESTNSPRGYHSKTTTNKMFFTRIRQVVISASACQSVLNRCQSHGRIYPYTSGSCCRCELPNKYSIYEFLL